MNAPPVFFQTIPIDLPLEKIYKRLGYRKYFTELPDKQRARIDAVIEEAFGFCRLNGVYRRFTISNKDHKEVILDTPGTPTKFLSADFADFLKDAAGLFLFAVTAGHKISDQRDALIKQEKAFEGIIYDAVGSEAADAAVSWLNKYLVTLLIKEGRTLTGRRYSPGYGDLGLEYQKFFITHLQLEEIGVQLTASFLLQPEKSVTAAAGIIG